MPVAQAFSSGFFSAEASPACLNSLPSSLVEQMDACTTLGMLVSWCPELPVNALFTFFPEMRFPLGKDAQGHGFLRALGGRSLQEKDGKRSRRVSLLTSQLCPRADVTHTFIFRAVMFMNWHIRDVF